MFGDSVSSKKLIQHNRSYYERACNGELTRISAKTWDLRETSTTPTVTAKPIHVDKAITQDRYTEIAKRFSMLKILGNGVVEGNIRTLIVTGKQIGRAHV